jgi:putative spermidine/putrescine transport system substrate-binding protein
MGETVGKIDTLSRRRFLQLGALSALSGNALNAAPQILIKKDYTIRVLGTHVTLQEELRQQAMKDLGIKVTFEPGGSAQVLHKASTRPQSFDLYEQWSNSIKILWQAGAIQSIDTKRLTYWEQVNSLAKTGKLTDEANYGAGDAPYKLLYAQKDKDLGQNPTKEISFLPYVHNADSLGYNSAVIPKGIPYETESWAWLLDEQYRGKVAIVNAPTIGLFDLALAAQAKGLVSFKDIGNLSRDELNKLFKILIDYKKQGHFRGVWGSVPQSVDFMEKDGVVIESMFSPGVSALNGKGIPCIYAAPKEGYRAWHGVMCLSSKTSGQTKDAAYEYMNWWLSGWPGAFIARQGYYISTPQLSKPHLSDDEWNYWYKGKTNQSDLKNTQGEIAVKAGNRRTGGSYENRFANIAVWNTVMDTYEYSLLKWQEFLLA